MDDMHTDMEGGTPPGSPPPRTFSVPPGQTERTVPPTPNPAPPANPAVWMREEVPIIHLVKEVRKRHKKGSEKAKSWKVSWVWGTKLAFFEARREQWMLAVASAEGPGAFYTKMARLYALKYPESLKDDEDLERDILDPLDELADIVVNYVGAAGKAKAAEHTHLRKRIGQWYRLHYGSLVKTGQSTFVKIFSGVLDVAPPKPGRPQLMHFYSRKFYEERIQDRFVARMESLKKRAEFTDEPEPKALSVLPIVMKEAWDDKSPGLQEEVKEVLEREYKLAIKGWEASLADSPTRTPEEMAATLENAAFSLQPFVDAIMERFGMCASVFLCGPIGRKGGAISMQSVHAGKTRGLAPLSWPLFDRLGFSEVEKSMVTFGRDCFSKAECRARATAEVVTAPGRGIGEASTSVSEEEVVGAGSNMPEMASGSGAAMSAGEESDSAGGSTIPPGEGASAVGASVAGEVERTGGEAGAEVGMEAQGANGGAVSTDEVVTVLTEEEAAALAMEKKIDNMWQHDDRELWSSEMGKVHAALARGKRWGIEWARCVRNFFDFEAAHGYDENGGEKVPTSTRPDVLQRWIGCQRLWFSPMTITDVGAEGQEGTFANEWWIWWRAMQPEDREWVGSMLTCPETEWTEMRTYFGRNGMLHVMAILWWWGEAVSDDDPLGRMNWSLAVEDVAWALEEMLVGEAKSAKKGKKQAATPKRGRMEDEVDVEAQPAAKRTRGMVAAEGRQMRSSTKKPAAKAKPAKAKPATKSKPAPKEKLAAVGKKRSAGRRR